MGGGAATIDSEQEIWVGSQEGYDTGRGVNRAGFGCWGDVYFDMHW